jgi:rod shape-determining protein MreC
VLYPFIAMQRGAVDRDGRFADAALVRAERDSLAAFLVGQASLAAENRRLRGLLGMRERLPNSFVAAEVMPFEGAAAPGTSMVTVGTEEGVQPGAAIVTAQGLVGSVTEVFRGYSVANNWTNPNFRASAVSEDGETYGILQPHEGRGGEQLLALTSTALHTVPRPGTTIVTSGSGATYPRGIPIGTVVDTANEASGWQRIYLVRPFVSPAEMTHVLVLGAPKAGATDRDLAAAWGIRLREGPPPDSTMLPRAPATAAAPAARPAGPARPAAPRPQGPRLLGREAPRPRETPAVTAPVPTPPPVQPQTPPDTSRRVIP